MAGRGSKSRKRSATSSRWRPEGLVFFLDRSLGRIHVRQALRERGAQVEIHDDHFPADARDSDWLPEVGRRGWIVLMKDKRIRRNQLEREALRASGVRAFVLTSGNLTGPEMAEVFGQHLPKMVRIVRGNPGPFVAGVSRSRITMYHLEGR